METTYSTKCQTALTERQAGFAQTERSLGMQKARYTLESTKDERESEERWWARRCAAAVRRVHRT
jgi:ribosomal protein S19E (S16A)